MEDFHRLVAVSVNFNRSIVNFTHGLDFDMVTPDSISAFVIDVLVYLLFAALNKTWEVRLLNLDVLHTFLAHDLVLLLVSVRLVSYCSEQAISILTDVENPHVFLLQLSLEFLFLLLSELPLLFERKPGHIFLQVHESRGHLVDRMSLSRPCRNTFHPTLKMTPLNNLVEFGC